jgi:hypothetical protein
MAGKRQTTVGEKAGNQQTRIGEKAGNRRQQSEAGCVEIQQHSQNYTKY